MITNMLYDSFVELEAKLFNVTPALMMARGYFFLSTAVVVFSCSDE